MSNNTTVRITIATGDIKLDAAKRHNARDQNSSVGSGHSFVSRLSDPKKAKSLLVMIMVWINLH